MCACPGPLPALVLTTQPEPEERRSSGRKHCLGRPGRSQLSIHPLHFPSLGLWSLTFLIFSRDFVFPGTWGSSAFPVTAHFSCSLLTYGVHASAALLSSPFIILGTSRSSAYSSESSRCGSCLSMAGSLGSPHMAVWLCLRSGGDSGPESPGAAASSLP